MDGDIYPTDAPGIGSHDLCDVYFYACEIDVFALCFDAHGGDHAGAESCGYEVGGGETLTFALVVCGGICFNFALALQVCGTGPELSFINDGRSHGC